MVQLPTDFTEQTRLLMGQERFERYLKSFEEEPPVSIRLNPKKSCGLEVACGELVPWCRNGYYLGQRPVFTFDPLFHAGSYYVQEAASMFLDEVLRQLLPSASSLHAALDLCAAPGGKSTLLRSALPADCMLYSNEPVRQRASILLENVTKWGYANHVVTNCYPRDYRKSKMMFDLILCDVPCSGEGMFRKDPRAVAEWSEDTVRLCASRQRRILADMWPSLRSGGLLIYSTCTFAQAENDDNVSWVAETLGGEVIRPACDDEGVLGTACGYLLVPGLVPGEGQYAAAVRKGEGPAPSRAPAASLEKLHPLRQGVRKGTWKGKDFVPDPDWALSLSYERGSFPEWELDRQTALHFLHRDVLVLPDAPRGFVLMTFHGLPLGFVKNVGSRCNNLHPQGRRILMDINDCV